MNIKIYPNSEALVAATVEIFVTLAAESVAARGRFSVALSGGSTPRALYARLAAPDVAARLPWQAVHLFWGDERCVASDHTDSNYRMTAESLLNRVPIPAGNIHRIQGELTPDEAARRYEKELRNFFGDAPRFDLVLLGLGNDGHTASLFASSPALTESTRWAVEVEHVTPPAPLVARVTLTLEVFNAARRVIFLATGAGKAERLTQIQRGDSLPAGHIQPQSGEPLWLVDESAASGLKGES